MGKYLVISQPTHASSSRSRYAAGEPAFVQDDATTGTGGYKETACGISPAVSGAYVSGFYARMGLSLYQMDLKPPDEGMQEKALELELHLDDLYLDLPLLLVIFPPWPFNNRSGRST